MAPRAGIDVFADPSVACRALARRDAGLRRALVEIGAPHIRRRPGGFEGLFRIIVEQQVSVPSAQAILQRLAAGCDTSCPVTVERTGVEALRSFGLSAPKARYVVDIARAAKEGEIDFDRIAALDDHSAAAALTALRGVGPWTAAIYLLFCEGRVDIWPVRDVALKAAYSAAHETPVDQASLDAGAEDWAPYRGVAAHILWTYYAKIRGRRPI